METLTRSFSADVRFVWLETRERKLTDRIFEATPMSGYGHPLRVSVFVGVVQYVDDDVVVEPNALPQSISSADRSGCCCKCGWR